MSGTTITDVATVAVTVADQDRARAFYVDTLGFEVRLDVPMPGGGRWLTVAPPGAAVALALTAGELGTVGRDTGWSSGPVGKCSSARSSAYATGSRSVCRRRPRPAIAATSLR